MRSAYGQGFNYLVSEDTEKAIKSLSTMVESHRDALEIQQALAKLFRKNGEVGKAIDLHERLLQTPHLTEEQRYQIHFELAADYMSAGLYDRAELLFLGLSHTMTHGRAATLALLNIYQAEKEWDKAIQCLAGQEGGDWLQRQEILAQLHCEQAEAALMQGNTSVAEQRLLQALQVDSRCVRASLVRAKLAVREQRWSDASMALRSVEWQNPVFLSETLDLLRLCHMNLGETAEYRAYLEYLYLRHGNEYAGIRLADEITAVDGPGAALQHLEGLLLQRPVPLVMLKAVQYLNAGNLDEGLMPIMQRLNTALDLLASHQLPYRCRSCGFGAHEIHWLCPSCREWGSVQPCRQDG
ncbi:MAG: lipopolysaccharide assembly protein LapB [Pseudomonadota bacterium]